MIAKRQVNYTIQKIFCIKTIEHILRIFSNITPTLYSCQTKIKSNLRILIYTLLLHSYILLLFLLLFCYYAIVILLLFTQISYFISFIIHIIHILHQKHSHPRRSVIIPFKKSNYLAISSFFAIFSSLLSFVLKLPTISKDRTLFLSSFF